MDRTAQLGLPLVMPAQAQKHVTVNESLARLDALTQLRVRSSSETVPPADPLPGDSYIIPSDAVGDWAGRPMHIATALNGGWVYSAPRIGWRAWDEAEHVNRLFNGFAWTAGALVASSEGAESLCRIVQFDHDVTVGTFNDTQVTIPSHALLIGVTGRVVESLTGGDLTSWRLGVPSYEDRYGSSLGVFTNAYVHGMTGMPLVYFEETPLRLTAEGGQFAGGRVRLAMHILELHPPRAI